MYSINQSKSSEQILLETIKSGETNEEVTKLRQSIYMIMCSLKSAMEKTKATVEKEVEKSLDEEEPAGTKSPSRILGYIKTAGKAAKKVLSVSAVSIATGVDPVYLTDIPDNGKICDVDNHRAYQPRFWSFSLMKRIQVTLKTIDGFIICADKVIEVMQADQADNEKQNEWLQAILDFHIRRFREKTWSNDDSFASLFMQLMLFQPYMKDYQLFSEGLSTGSPYNFFKELNERMRWPEREYHTVFSKYDDYKGVNATRCVKRCKECGARQFYWNDSMVKRMGPPVSTCHFCGNRFSSQTTEWRCKSWIQKVSYISLLTPISLFFSGLIFTMLVFALISYPLAEASFSLVVPLLLWYIPGEVMVNSERFRIEYTKSLRRTDNEDCLRDNQIDPCQLGSEQLPFPFFFLESSKLSISNLRARPLTQDEWHRHW